MPDHIQRTCEDAHWTLMNVNEVMARHAGHVDFMCETIDGATMRYSRR